MRHSGISPARERWSRPGSSLRRARSPVAPNSTMTYGRTGAIRVGTTSLGSLMTFPPDVLRAGYAAEVAGTCPDGDGAAVPRAA